MIKGQITIWQLIEEIQKRQVKEIDFTKETIITFDDLKEIEEIKLSNCGDFITQVVIGDFFIYQEIEKIAICNVRDISFSLKFISKDDKIIGSSIVIKNHFLKIKHSKDTYMLLIDIERSC